MLRQKYIAVSLILGIAQIYGLLDYLPVAVEAVSVNETDKEGEGGQMHIGRIVEFFRSTDEEDYFRVQWFYKAEDTVIKEEAASHDSKRVFYSTVMNDNPIDCIVSKVNILKISNTASLILIGLKRQLSQKFDFYFDMEYCVDYSTFRALRSDSSFSKGHDLPGPRLLDALAATNGVSASSSNISVRSASQNGSCKRELVLLDLFSGCGGMSTGLCIGAALSGVHLVVRWALDSNKSACESLKLNHPETQVRSEAAEDFLALLKEWEKLCKRFMVTVPKPSRSKRSTASLVKDSNNDTLNEADIDIVPGEFEVSRIVDICFGDPKSTGNHGLKLKVHWKGYSENEDSWEPIESLSNCQECIRDFVRNGVKSKILPVPGDVDVICGGPPCQGISGYNRFRNVVSPLDDERNRQIAVFMDIVQFLKPKFVLMENVVDILRFDKASLARYALSRLVQMKYQARLGTVAAGCYGLPQFRLRVFLWGAHASEKLPQFPLPTHDVIVRYWPPPEFERNTVAYDEEQPRPLERAIILQDAISDLPAVTSHETREQMPYDKAPETEFQVFIRAPKSEMIGHPKGRGGITKDILHDHRTYTLTDEDYARVCHIPKRKGANFRDLPGIVVGADNVTRRDPKVDQILLPSGKPLVPDFALTFSQGKSRRPYGRLWWDETVPTVVTYPDLHSQAVLHPDQDRVLTIRECARLQGFPDYYRFCGTVKARYRQIGNAVAVPVGRALGYAMGMAALGLSDDEPLMCLPKKFSHSTNLQLQEQQLETVGNPTFE
ncbi:DNA (cytosine-5)-methyltransferase CMT2 [Linum perenne]